MLDLTPHHLRFDVLIETYWNVNQCIGGRGALIKLVLIETYWNVNCIYTPSHVRAPGINRNILECKEPTGLTILVGRLRINRNILECKG